MSPRARRLIRLALLFVALGVAGAPALERASYAEVAPIAAAVATTRAPRPAPAPRRARLPRPLSRRITRPAASPPIARAPRLYLRHHALLR